MPIFPRYKQEPIRVQHSRRTMGVLGYKKVVYRNQYLWRGQPRIKIVSSSLKAL